MNDPIRPLLKTDPVADHLAFDEYIETFDFSSKVKKDVKTKAITHFNHNGEENTADHIWLKNSPFSRIQIQCTDSFVFPLELPQNSWPPSHLWTLSDHRPLFSKFLASVPKK